MPITSGGVLACRVGQRIDLGNQAVGRDDPVDQTDPLRLDARGLGDVEIHAPEPGGSVS